MPTTGSYAHDSESCSESSARRAPCGTVQNQEMDIATEHDAEQHRFILRAGVDIAAFSEYFDTDGARNFFHTVTFPHHRGRSYAAVLTEYALDQTAYAGLGVVPTCWFVREFIETNIERYGHLTETDPPSDAP